MTARKTPAPQPCPYYVPPRFGGWSRVTFTAELPKSSYSGHPSFLGEMDGTAVVYDALDTPSGIQIRHAIQEHGKAIADVTSQWMHEATPKEIASVVARCSDTGDPIPLSAEERVSWGVLRALIRAGQLRPADGADGAG
jgi:hypothetical protein